jgi:hypothetical protein
MDFLEKEIQSNDNFSPVRKLSHSCPTTNIRYFHIRTNYIILIFIIQNTNIMPFLEKLVYYNF